MPRAVEWRGRAYFTAIWKSPVKGRVEVMGTNLVGDAQAHLTVHGGPDKAVYAYASEDYAWWSHLLRQPVGAGHFGDNLTVEGFDPRRCVIGERWRVGTAILQVTQPRLPCVKLAVRMKDPQFPRRFLEAGLLGAYLRVIEDGSMGAGDRLTVIDVPSTGMTLKQTAEMRAGPLHRSGSPEHRIAALATDATSNR